jgi:hypothetical protein
MNSWVLQVRKLLLISLLLGGTVQFALGHIRSLVSGTYRVAEKTALGGQMRVRLQLNLANYGNRDVLVHRITLWDSSHPEKGGTQACSIRLRARGSTGITQEFTIRRSEYELWKRGAQPRLVLEMQTAAGRKTTEAIRLHRVGSGKAD